MLYLPLSDHMSRARITLPTTETTIEPTQPT
jgi:hypothetical protein